MRAVARGTTDRTALSPEEMILRSKRWLLSGLQWDSDDELGWIRHTKTPIRTFSTGRGEADLNELCRRDHERWKARQK